MQIPTRKVSIHIINHEGLYQTIFLATKTLQKKPLTFKKMIYLFPLPLSTLLLHTTKYGNF